MRAIRIVVASGVAVFAVVAAFHLAWRPLRCDLLKQQAEVLGPQLRANAGMRSTSIGRETIERLQRCIDECPFDGDLYVLAGYYDTTVGRLDDAAAMFKQALKYERRPEIYYDLAVVQTEMNQGAAALDNYAMAVQFNQYLAEEIDDPFIRAAVKQRVEARQRHPVAPRIN